MNWYKIYETRNPAIADDMSDCGKTETIAAVLYQFVALYKLASSIEPSA